MTTVSKRVDVEIDVELSDLELSAEELWEELSNNADEDEVVELIVNDKGICSALVTAACADGRKDAIREWLCLDGVPDAEDEELIAWVLSSLDATPPTTTDQRKEKIAEWLADSESLRAFAAEQLGKPFGIVDALTAPLEEVAQATVARPESLRDFMGALAKVYTAPYLFGKAVEMSVEAMQRSKE